MTTHLAPDQFTDALDGAAVPPAVQAHLASCDSCRGRLDALLVVARQASGADSAGEPSPLFWDHFSARVRQATSAIPVQTRWWERWAAAAVRPAMAMAAVLLAALLSTMLRSPAPSDAVVPRDPAAPQAMTVAANTDDDAVFDLMLNLASDLSPEAIHEISPSAFAATGVVDRMTPEERAMFVRLVKEEFGGTE
jgi:hypothetical protein